MNISKITNYSFEIFIQSVRCNLGQFQGNCNKSTIKQFAQYDNSTNYF